MTGDLEVASVARLYETAESLWHVGEGQMLFDGCLGRNAQHSHSAPVLLAGLYDDFALRIGKTSWFHCRAAVIPAGIVYEFDSAGRPLAVLYIEPNVASVEGLAALLGETTEISSALVGRRGEISLIRALYEDPDGPRWAGAAIADLVGFSHAKSRRLIDGRIARAVENLTLTSVAENENSRVPPSSLAGAAHEAGLSASRFRHVFKDQVGVPFTRYRAWARLRTAVREVVAGSNFTGAAHAAGFYDQAHFAHEFRRTFGAPASKSLARVRR
jgi:AraC-like DNA-binding protein